MNHLKTINIIIAREFSTRVKKKSFIWITILTPLLMAACFVIPMLLTSMSGGEKGRQVSVVDKSGIVASSLNDNEDMVFNELPADTDVEALKAGLDEDKKLYAIVVLSAQDSAGDISVVSYSKEPLSLDVKQAVSEAVKKSVEDCKLRKYDIVNLDKIMTDISTDVKFNAITVTKQGEKEDNVVIYMVIAYVLSFLIYIFIAMFGGMVMRGVIEEKSSRVVEVIVSSVRSVDLMIGKIVGVALVALTQFLIWIVFTLVLLIGFQVAVGVNVFADRAPAAMEQVAAAAGGASMGVSSASDLGASIQKELDNPDSDIAGVVKGIKAVNFPYIIVCFLLYFILGYLLYASMYAAVGSAVDNETDTQQLMIPITAPLIIGLFVMLQAFQYPDAPLAVWCSIIPWTSPMVMLARLPFGNVPFWQLAASLLLLLLAFLGTAWVSAKIYRVGILSYGKKATFKDLMKWTKYKN